MDWIDGFKLVFLRFARSAWLSVCHWIGLDWIESLRSRWENIHDDADGLLDFSYSSISLLFSYSSGPLLILG